MILQIPVQAEWSNLWKTTGRLRWAVAATTTTAEPILQQEWVIVWGNNMGPQETTEWVDVPRVVL